MRILCLNLHKPAQPEIAEIFLKFSPQIHFSRRKIENSHETGLVFIDIGKTAHLFSGECTLLREALNLAKTFFPHATAAISDTPAGAQVFAAVHSSFICEPGRERELIGQLPLKALVEFEGLHAWENASGVNQIVSLFHILGLRHIEQILDLRCEVFRERWGKVGELLWKRLHGLDAQVISPLKPSETFSHYTYLDDPVSLLSFLLYHVEQGMTLLHARLRGRACFASKIKLALYCEYSGTRHDVWIELTPAGRDLKLILDLIEQKLSSLDFENPIRQMEIDLQVVPEQVKQFNFFEPRTSDQDRLQRLLHLFRQKGVSNGFLKIYNRVFPEATFALSAEPGGFSPLESDYEVSAESTPEGGMKKNTVFGEFPKVLPRPSQLLPEPVPLRPGFLRQLKPQLFPHVERLEERWWESFDRNTESRDYQFALSPKGQLMWLFKKSAGQDYYLHGYCD